MLKCKYCDSESIVRNGHKNGVQQWLCRDCGHQFLENGNYVKMRTEPEIISAAIDLYFDGLSVWKVKRQLAKIFRVRVSQMTVWKWVVKYSRLVNEFVDSLSPRLSGIWQVDETMVNCRSKGGGRFRWFWQIIDVGTRWIVATHLSGDRPIEEAVKLFKKSTRLTRDKPKEITTDGLWAYRKAYTKVFWTRYKAERPRYVRVVGVKDGGTNIIERLHGTLKDRTKAMRGMKGEESCEALLNGWRIHYNFIKPHISLDGKTPAQVSEINLNLENGWGSLVQLATIHKTNHSVGDEFGFGKRS